MEEREFEKVYKDLSKDLKLDVEDTALLESEEKPAINYGALTRTTHVPPQMICK